MSDIFISYAHEDRPWVVLLAKALEDCGWSVWWDTHIPTGRRFDDVIDQALAEAKCIIVVWSGKSILSTYVRAEASEGDERQILFPVIIEEVRIPLPFRQIQTANLLDWHGSIQHQGFKRLVKDISLILTAPQTFPASAATKPERPNASQPISLSRTDSQITDAATPNPISFQIDKLLTEQSAEAVEMQRTANQGHSPPYASRKLWTIAALALLLALLTLWALSRLFSPVKPTAPVLSESIKKSKLTRTGKSGFEAVISPDGKYVAHVVTEGEKQGLWVLHVATSRNVQVAPLSQAQYRSLSFSRDSNYIYYAMAEPSSPVGVLYQVGALGGRPKRIIDDIDSPISISPDNSRFVFRRGIHRQGRNELVIADMDGRNERTLAVRKLPDIFDSPAWSPDGGVIACSALTGAGGAYMSVITINAADGTEKPLTSEKWPSVGRVAWVEDGSGLVMDATDPTTLQGQIWHLSYPNGEMQRITNDFSNYSNVSLTADSKGLITIQSDSIANLWVAPVGNSDKSKQITSGTGKYGRVSWTFDGKLLCTTSDGGDINIWVMDADGSNQKELTANSGRNFQPTGSPDGHYIVFASTRGVGPNDNNIWRMDADGGNPVQLTSSGSELSPTFSPDGKWVVYQSYASGRARLWKVPVNGGEPVQLTDTSSFLPAVSPDGKYIACGYWDEQLNSPVSVAIIPFEGGQPLRTFNIPQWLVRWTADGSSLMFLDNRGSVTNIWLQPITGGTPKQLTNFKSDLIFSFDWSRDNNLVCSRGIVTRDIVMITGFR